MGKHKGPARAANQTIQHFQSARHKRRLEAKLETMSLPQIKKVMRRKALLAGLL